MTWTKPDVLRCKCFDGASNPPLSQNTVYAILEGPNEPIATMARCFRCGAVENLRVYSGAMGKYGFTTASLAGLIGQSQMPSFYPRELKSGKIPGATPQKMKLAQDVLRPVEGYDPDKFIEPSSQGDLL